MNTQFCKYCKSFSKVRGVGKGYCLRLKKSTDINSVCCFFRPDCYIEYEQEYKNSWSPW